MARLLKDKYVSSTVRSQIIDADQLMLTKADLAEEGISLEDCVGNSPPIPPIIDRETFLGDLPYQLTRAIGGSKTVSGNHAEHQYHWIALEQVSLDRLGHFLASPPAGLVRVKGFVNSGEHQYLVQADTAGCTITQRAPSTKSTGLQVIGTPGMDLARVITALRKAVTESSWQSVHATQLRAP